MDVQKIWSQFRRFLVGEEALVTLEWVAIAAAVIVLGVGVIIILKPSINTAASSVGSNLLSAVNSNT